MTRDQLQQALLGAVVDLMGVIRSDLHHFGNLREGHGL